VFALGLGVAGACAVAWSPGCSRAEPPGAAPTRAVQVTASSASPSASAATRRAPAASASAVPDDVAKMLAALESDGGAPDPKAAESGPRIGVLSAQAQIYAQPNGARESRVGYLRRGAKVLADHTIVKGKVCEEGWYKLVPYGYVCAKHATTNLDDPEVRMGMREPAVDDILPYKYAFNVAHGTPLYRTVPTRDEWIDYEPYLNATKRAHKDRAERTASVDGKKRKKKRKGDAARPPETTEEPTTTDAKEQPATSPDAGAPPALPSPDASVAAVPDTALDAGVADAEADAEPKVWWQRSYEPGQHPDVKLSDLTEGSDRLMAKRMVKGFYVAVDRTFVMNDRAWHKTTAGLLAPADRFALVKPNPFHGAEIDESHQNGVGFVIAKTAAKYELDPAKNTMKPVGSLERYDRAFLTGKTITVGTRTFHETTDGWWMRDGDTTWTAPGEPPPSLKPGEKWVDVNLTRQTLVAFEGTRQVFATLVSTGRKGKDKEHDHQTPTGMWRVREKHVAATMDGDGAAAGDLPYSIEDVPYVQYFHESYALHGAFWHDNFGRPQSHGCVNLAPSDAKRLFFWADPAVPHGWHGVFSSHETPGMFVVVHE
jgi:hypothetical protein